MAAHPPESSTASGPICPYMTLCRLGTSRRQRVSVPSGRGRPRRSGRVYLDRPVPVLQVVEVRYQAGGEFGSGFKPRPKSDASIRELPLAPLVIESIRRQLPPDSDPDLLVFTGPGGGNGIPVGTRTMLSRYNFRRVYQRAVARARHDLAAVDPLMALTICATPSRLGWKTPAFPLG
jgi:hypothetical protein